MTKRKSSSALLLLPLVMAHIPSLVQAQYCTRLANQTFPALVEALKDSYRLALLCPFKITGNGCPSEDEYPNGYFHSATKGKKKSDLIVVCDRNEYGYQTGAQCVIDCPGRHFTVDEKATLTLDSFVLMGATNSSLSVQPKGKLEVINSVFSENFSPEYGGAIHAGEDSKLDIEYSEFANNEALVGGAVYSKGKADIVHTNFFSNVAAVAVRCKKRIRCCL